MSPRFKYTPANFVGRVFTRLTVLRFYDFDMRYRWKRQRWVCRCVCGTEKVIDTACLVSGATQSCGCLHKEVVTALKNRLRHGMTYTGIYNTWCGMKARCYDKNDINYHNYGGRGISICREWLVFDNFLRDMGEAWKPKLTIERKDVNGNYNKQNCCWIKKQRQACNTRRTAWIKYNGVVMCRADASRLSGVPYSTLKNRIKNKCPINFMFAEVNMTTPIEVSDSQIKTFQECPRKWAYTKILGLTPEENRNAMHFGNAWHDGAEEYIRSRNLEKAINASIAALNKDKPTDLENSKLLVPALLTGWVLHWLPSFEKEYEYVALEEWFSVSPSPSVLTIRGFKDAVVVHRQSRQRCVFDYKTSSAAYAADLIATLTSNNQLARYATAERRQYGSWPMRTGLVMIMKPRNKDINVACENARCDPDLYRTVSQDVTPEFAEFAISVEHNDTVIAHQMKFYRDAIKKEGPKACDYVPANFNKCYSYGSFCGFSSGCHKAKPAHQALINKPA